MRLSIKEKAGIVDTSRIFEGLHLGEEFIRNMAGNENKKNIASETLEEGERHIRICTECRHKFELFKQEPKEQDLPF